MIENYFPNYEIVKDDKNPFTHHYVVDNNIDFYIERIFLTKLDNFFSMQKENKEIVLQKMDEVIKKNKHVVFCGDFEFIQTEVGEHYIYLEIEDILNPLNIYVEDKSRGSDYGD